MQQFKVQAASTRIVAFAEAHSIIDAFLSKELGLEIGQSALCRLQFLGNEEHDQAISNLTDQLLEIPHKKIRKWEARSRSTSPEQVEAAEVVIEASGESLLDLDLDATMLEEVEGVFSTFQRPTPVSRSSDDRTMSKQIQRAPGRAAEVADSTPPRLIHPDAKAVAAPRSISRWWRDSGELRRQLRRDLYQLQRSSCPLDFERELEATKQMVDGVVGIDQNGTQVEVFEGLVKVGTCTWEGTDYPTVYLDLNVYKTPGLTPPDDGELPILNETLRAPVYFHSGYIFHPDAQPSEAEEQRLQESKPSSANNVHVVDTGWPWSPYPTSNSHHDVEDIDPFDQHELAWGHGPAIVDVVNRLVPESAKLTQVRYFDGWVRSTNLAPAALLFPAPNGSDMIRGFDGLALTKALDALVLNDGDVVNCSFGTVACVQDMRNEDRVARWIEKRSNCTFVVAAGNHGSEVSHSDPPSFPAAYAPSSNRPSVLNTNLPAIANVRAVGSADDGLGTSPHMFSAKGAWVTHWQDGEHVPVEHPRFTAKTAKANATWSGTSFAAPRFAANLI